MTGSNMSEQEQSYKSPERLDIARRVQHWRERASLRKVDLARALAIDPSMVSKWERAEMAPTPENLARIAEACGVTMSTFWSELPPLVDPIEQKAG